MNIKQQKAWRELVCQCETQCARRPYSSINVASQIRSDAIVAAGALTALVTEETASLLERLGKRYDWSETSQLRTDCKEAHALAAQIREALDDNKT